MHFKGSILTIYPPHKYIQSVLSLSLYINCKTPFFSQTAYINDAIASSAYYEGLATIQTRTGFSAADFRLNRADFICGRTGNLSYECTKQM